jgi:hypothetical protein
MTGSSRWCAPRRRRAAVGGTGFVDAVRVASGAGATWAATVSTCGQGRDPCLWARTRAATCSACCCCRGLWRWCARRARPDLAIVVRQRRWPLPARGRSAAARVHPYRANPAIVAPGAWVPTSRCAREEEPPVTLHLRSSRADDGAIVLVPGIGAPAITMSAPSPGRAEQLAETHGAPARLDRVFVQVGAGPAAAVGRGFVGAPVPGSSACARAPAVQTGSLPLVRSWTCSEKSSKPRRVPPHHVGSGPRTAALLERRVPDRRQWLAHAAAEPAATCGHGGGSRTRSPRAFDDVTYDWLGVVDR